MVPSETSPTLDPLDLIRQQFETLAGQEDLYHGLNQFRDWMNHHVVNYEVYLEDNWFEDKTTIEYIFRCIETFNILVFAEDKYQNHIDQGTWHLGDYETTYFTVPEPWIAIEAFIRENGLPRLTPLQI